MLLSIGLILCLGAPDAIAQRPPIAAEEISLLVDGPSPGQQPPDFSATDLDGKSHRLRDYSNQVVVLHFWATWCPYCRAEVQKLKTIQQRWGASGVAILAISVDEDTSQLRRFVQTQQLSYTVISEVQNRQHLSDMYAVEGIPMTYVINRSGVVAFRFEGRADLVGAVRRLLAAH